MANSPQARKRIRQTARKTAVNTARRSRIRTFLRKAEEAIVAGNQENAMTALRAAESEVMRGVSKGVIKKNTGARTVSRLNARVKALG